MLPFERYVRFLAAGFVGVALFSMLGCVETSLREGRIPMNYEPIETAALAEPSEGSIWRGTTPSGSFLFFDSKAFPRRGPRHSGDHRTDSGAGRCQD